MLKCLLIAHLCLSHLVDDRAGVRAPILHDLLARVSHNEDRYGGSGPDHLVRGARLWYPGGRRDRHQAGARRTGAGQVPAADHQ